MALTNKGFNGTVDEAAWARMSRIGDAEGVDGATSWLVTAGAGRQVSCAAQNGYAFAAGVLSKDGSSPLTAALSTPVNGQWFLIVRRIDWATDTVTLVAVPHTTTTTTIPTVPPSSFPTINQDPGVLYDQPLAWAWDRSTDTTVVTFDLRGLPLKDRMTTVEGMLLRNVADLNALILLDPAAFEGRRIHVDELNVDFQTQDGVWVQDGVARFASTAARDTAYAKASGAFLVAYVAARVGAVVYEYGSAWVEVDTGWQDIGTLAGSSFGANVTGAASGGYAAVSVRRINNVVHIRGIVSKSTNWAFNDPILTVPAGWRPAAAMDLHFRQAGIAFAAINSSGLLAVVNFTTTGVAVVAGSWAVG